MIFKWHAEKLQKTGDGCQAKKSGPGIFMVIMLTSNHEAKNEFISRKKSHELIAMNSGFWGILFTVLSALSLMHAVEPTNAPDVLIADFEQKTWNNGWKVEGDAFGDGGMTVESGKVAGIYSTNAPKRREGNGWLDSRWVGDGGNGEVVLPKFTINRKYIRFLIAGAYSPGNLGIELWVNGTMVRSASGVARFRYDFQKEEWDVSDLRGKQANIRVFDHAKGWEGSILVDHIVQCDVPEVIHHSSRTWENAPKHLLFPVSIENGDITWMNVWRGDKIVRKLPISLAKNRGQAEWWASLDIPKGEGRLKVEAERISIESQGIALIMDTEDGEDYFTPYHSGQRPQFHFTARRGWIMDPDGLVYDKGEWHMFYQHNPFSLGYAIKLLWGHAVSKDLVHWEERSLALWDGLTREYYSGSAIVDTQNVAGLGKGTMLLFASQASPMLFYSRDCGFTFQEYASNPVVKWQGRDPHVFWYSPGSHWVMVTQSDERKDFSIHTSTNLLDWAWQSGVKGFHECPQLFDLPVDGNESEKAWVMYGADNQYQLGTFDGKQFLPKQEKKRGCFGIKLGYPFYAARTFNHAKDDRRIEIGTLTSNAKGVSFERMQTIPLELSLIRGKGGVKMHSYPVKELLKLRGEKIVDRQSILKGGVEESLGIDGDLKDIEMEVEMPAQAGQFRLRADQWDLLLDSRSNEMKSGAAVAPLDLLGKMIRLRILMDRGVVEVFANQGEVYMPVVYPCDDKNSVRLSSPMTMEFSGGGEAQVKVTAYPMKSMYEVTR